MKKELKDKIAKAVKYSVKKYGKAYKMLEKYDQKKEKKIKDKPKVTGYKAETHYERTEKGLYRKTTEYIPIYDKT